MAEFEVSDKKFFNQYRNGLAFTDNLSESTDRPVGNAGDKLKMTQTVGVRIFINDKCSITINLDDSDPVNATFQTNSLDWEAEGLSPGSVIDIEYDGKLAVDVPVVAITGESNDVLVVEKANIVTAGLPANNKRKDFIFKLKTAPLDLTYKYGLNAIKNNIPNYASPFDGQEQAYHIDTVTADPTFVRMAWKGNEISADLGTVDVKFDGTDATTYVHTYSVEHIFLIPYYFEGEFTNLEFGINPASSTRPVNLKYGNGYFFGFGKNKHAAIFEDVGGKTDGSGNIGWFDTNFDGNVLSYEVLNYVITNSLATGKLESTVVNTVTFSIKSNTPLGFVGGEKVLLTHTKLATQNESSKQKSSFDDIWLKETVEAIEGAGPSAGTIFTNVTVVLNGATFDLDVSADVTIPAGDQDKIANGLTKNLIYATIATENLADPEKIDRTNLRGEAGTYSKDPASRNLVQNMVFEVFEHWNFGAGVKKFTNHDGYNGDLLGVKVGWDMDVTNSPLIVNAKFKVGLYNGTDTHDLYSQNIPITFIQLVQGTFQYQAYGLLGQSDLNVPFSDDLGQVELKSVIPVPPTNPLQPWLCALAFQIPWREWIQNLNIPTTFYDSAEVNDNLNERTSNYSGVGGYDIRLWLELDVAVSDPLTQTSNITTYQLMSDPCAILDFNDPGATGFSAVTEYFDINGDQVQNIATNQEVICKVKYTHALGIIPLANIQGFVWPEKQNATNNPYYLSTEKNLTDPNSPILPSQELTSTNTEFVEVESVLNLVTFTYRTRPTKIQAAIYNMYGRIGNKV